MKIMLPAEPIDRYEITWWEVSSEKLYECRALYHVHRAWNEIYSGRGADFHDEWQYFRNGEFRGRVDGWNLLARPSWQDSFKHAFATREEALATVRRLLQQRIQRLRDEITEYEERLISGDFR